MWFTKPRKHYGVSFPICVVLGLARFFSRAFSKLCRPTFLHPIAFVDTVAAASKPCFITTMAIYTDTKPVYWIFDSRENSSDTVHFFSLEFDSSCKERQYVNVNYSSLKTERFSLALGIQLGFFVCLRFLRGKRLHCTFGVHPLNSIGIARV